MLQKKSNIIVKYNNEKKKLRQQQYILLFIIEAYIIKIKSFKGQSTKQFEGSDKIIVNDTIYVFYFSYETFWKWELT